MTLLTGMLKKRNPGRRIQIVARGVSGDTVPDLQKRLDRDVISQRPTHVVVFIGVNDVGQVRSSRRIRAEDEHVYRHGLLDIVGRIQAAGARAFLCTPAVFGDDPSSAGNANVLLDEYAEMSRQVAAETGAVLCDLRSVFKEYLLTHNRERRNEGVVTIDGVHLNDEGNRLVAGAILEVLDLRALPVDSDPPGYGRPA